MALDKAITIELTGGAAVQRSIATALNDVLCTGLLMRRQKMTEEAKKIIAENINLSTTVSISEMMDKQEELIEKFIKLGYTREQFYLFSRQTVGIKE